ncbi:MAG TPA: protein kinase, partial [Kofleriaceae bacterium]|nr:protein kinase [Kofleriaceae bacterium]
MGANPAPEEQFGPYLVYERLGVGGMATVHRALEHTSDGRERTVALKRLLPHLADDASFIKAFVREAKLASLLSHVNIVQIYELGRVGPAYFISMEYIDGRDVRQILRGARRAAEPPPIAITVALMIQLCDALDYAHHKDDGDGTPLGIVHRDVSPSNLLVNASGQLKIIDFGIAKAESSQLRTQTGRVKGKLAYMAPEAVAGGKDLDARSDIWACGVILHELLAARPLFASKNEYQTLLKVQRGDIMPPSTFNQSCPPELDAIVFRALARDPDERFALAADMRDELMALRVQYQLASGYRDVAGWIAKTKLVEPAVATRAKSKPRNRDDDEAVDLVWGTSESASMPIELPDVPDVSRKAPPRAQGDDGLDFDIDDDAPTPVPRQRGARFSSQLGDTDAGLRVPPATIDPALSAGTDPPRSRDHRVAQRSTGPRPAQRATAGDEALPAVTPGDRIATQRATPLPRAADTETDPVGRLTHEELFGGADDVLSGEPDAGETLPQFTDDGLPTVDSRVQAPTTNPMGLGLPLREPAPARPTPSPQPAAKPTATPVAAVPVVRFSKSIPPANTGNTPLPTRPTNRGIAVVAPTPVPAPAPAIVVPPAGDDHDNAAVTRQRMRRSSEISVGAGMVARHQGGARKWLLGGLGVVIVGGATALIVMSTGTR